MGSYASVAVRDAQGNITGYQSTSTGQIVETTGAASPAFQQAQAQYAEQRYMVVGSAPAYQQGSFQPYDPSGDVGTSGRAAIYAQQWQPLQQSQASIALENQPSRSTVPIHDLSDRMPEPVYADTSAKYTPGTDIYMAAGGYQTIRLADAKIVAGQNTGEFGVYQPSYDPNTGLMRRTLTLIGGGGRAALQSGMFSREESMAPANKTYEQWDIGKIDAVSKEYMDTHSRLGAEAYGGFSRELTGMLLTPDSQMSTYANPLNLANLVNPQGANMSKAEAPGIDIPWAIGLGSPQVQYADERGLTGKGYNFTEVTERAMDAGAIPTPFTSVGKSGAVVIAVTTSTETISPVTTGDSPIGVTISRLSQGQLPTVGELWESTPVSRIASNWTWQPSSIEQATTSVTDVMAQNRGTAGLLNTMSAIPLGSEIKFASESAVATRGVGVFSTTGEHLGGDITERIIETAKASVKGDYGFANDVEKAAKYGAEKFIKYETPTSDIIATRINVQIVGGREERVIFAQEFPKGQFTGTPSQFTSFLRAAKSAVETPSLAGGMKYEKAGFAPGVLGDIATVPLYSYPIVGAGTAGIGIGYYGTQLEQPKKIDTTSNVLGTGATLTAASAEGVDAAMREGGFAKPFVSPGTTIQFEQPTGAILGYNVPFISPAVAFFQPGKEIVSRESITNIPGITTLTGTTVTPITGGILTTKTYETVGGERVTTTTQTKSTQSGFDTFQNDISNKLYSGYGSLFGVSGERAKFALGVSKTVAVEQANASPTIENISTSMGVSDLQHAFEKPVEAGIAYAIGYGTGLGFKTLEGVYGVGKIATAEKVISEGGGWRSIDSVSGVVMQYGPKVLGVLYAGDVAYRSTSGFTNANAGDVSSRVAPILTFETLPMTAGAVHGYSTPGKIYETARMSDIGYKSAVQEGTTTGRFDYYVKQPAAKPIELLKQDYLSFKQEGVKQIKTGEIQWASDNIPISGEKISYTYRTETPGARDYVVEKLGFNKVPSPETPTLKYASEPTPGVSVGRSVTEPYASSIVSKAYGEPTTVFNAVKSKFEIAPPAEVIRNYYSYEGIEKVAYPTPKETVATPEVSRNYYPYEGIEKSAYPETSETMGMKFKAHLQENPNVVRDITTWFKNPKQEIADYNKMYELNKKFGGTQGEDIAGSLSQTGSPSGAAPSGRIGTKTVGGKTVSGLSPERSLKSQGLSESPSSIGRGFAESRSVDFRGNPVSKTMKPMGEQSKGVKQASAQIQIASEQLPAIEGITTTKVSPQQTPNIYPFSVKVSQKQESSIGAEVDVVQSVKSSREVMFAPQLQSIENIAEVTTIHSQTSEVSQRQILEQATSLMSDVGKASWQSVTQERATAFDRISGLKFDVPPGVVPIVSSDIKLTPVASTKYASDVITDQRVTTTQIPKTVTIVEPINTPVPVITTIPIPLPWGGGGLPSSGFLKPHGPRKTEIFSYAPRNIDILIGKSTKRAGKYLVNKENTYHW